MKDPLFASITSPAIYRGWFALAVGISEIFEDYSLTVSINWHRGRGLALMYDKCYRTGVERPRYFNTDNFVRIVFKRPDMSKWTHDGFVIDTIATENDTVGVSKHNQD